MKAIEFIEHLKNLPSFNLNMEIGFIIKEEDGQFRHCHTVKDIFGCMGPIIEDVNNYAIVELEK